MCHVRRHDVHRVLGQLLRLQLQQKKEMRM
jgi:hypothetical protein